MHPSHFCESLAGCPERSGNYQTGTLVLFVTFLLLQARDTASVGSRNCLLAQVCLSRPK
jgi:hypothetical protein